MCTKNEAKIKYSSGATYQGFVCSNESSLLERLSVTRNARLPKIYRNGQVQVIERS